MERRGPAAFLLDDELDAGFGACDRLRITAVSVLRQLAAFDIIINFF